MNATPENTLVLGIEAWGGKGRPDSVLMYEHSVKAMGIKPTILIYPEFNPANRGSYFTMVEKFFGDLFSSILPMTPHVKHILYADVRDVLFVRPLADICEIFNTFESPLVISGEPGCWPDSRDCFANQFKKESSFCLDYPNIGLWMAERDCLHDVLIQLKLAKTSAESGSTKLLVEKNDIAQYAWQIAIATSSIKCQIDYEAELFSTWGWTNPMWKRVESKIPLIGNNVPAILHFPGGQIDQMKDVYHQVFA